MPYPFNYFIEHGYYTEKPTEQTHFNPGEGSVVTDLLPLKIRNLLAGQGGSSHDGDFSRQDSAVITSILNAGFSPADAYATFIASPRGKHAAERKSGHFEDYVTRTISKAAGFIISKNSNGNGNGHRIIEADFSRNRRKESDVEDGLVMEKAKNISVERPHWLWYKYIPAGKITVLAGDPGMGKSTIALDLVSRISRGTYLPIGGRTVAGSCIIASAEDAAEDTIVPRLIAANANLDRINIIREVKIGGESQYLTLPRDLDRVEAGIVKSGARIVVIDPFSAFLERGTDTYKDQDVRSVLAPFEKIADRTGAAILIVAHLNKKEDANTLYRVGGSIGFIGAARSVLAVTNTDHGRVLYSLKANLSQLPKAIAYDTQELTKNKSGEEWSGDSKVKSSTIRWKGEVDFDVHQGTSVDESHAETEALDFLKQILIDEEICTDDIWKEARAAGISKSMLNRVKNSLGVTGKKHRDGKWYWKWSSGSDL